MFPVNEKLTRADLAFHASVSRMMPPMSEIGDYPGRRKNESLVSRWFFTGLKSVKTKPRDGVDETKALAHLQCVLRSFEPKHEHKIAAVAFLIHEWFEEFNAEVA